MKASSLVSACDGLSAIAEELPDRGGRLYSVADICTVMALAGYDCPASSVTAVLRHIQLADRHAHGSGYLGQEVRAAIDAGLVQGVRDRAAAAAAR